MKILHALSGKYRHGSKLKIRVPCVLGSWRSDDDCLRGLGKKLHSQEISAPPANQPEKMWEAWISNVEFERQGSNWFLDIFCGYSSYLNGKHPIKIKNAVPQTVFPSLNIVRVLNVGLFWVSNFKKKSRSTSHIPPIHIVWLVVDLPLWKIWVRQLGLWYSQLNGKIKVHGCKPPTSCWLYLDFRVNSQIRKSSELPPLEQVEDGAFHLVVAQLEPPAATEIFIFMFSGGLRSNSSGRNGV